MLACKKRFVCRTILVLLIAFPLKGLAQSLDVSYDKQPIERVIADLKKKTDYDFVYQKQVLENVPYVSGSYTGMTISQILDKLLYGTGLEYSIVKSTIIIRKSEPVSRNHKRIAGKVVGEEGETLPGVHVHLKHTNVGTTTNVDGEFSIMVSGTEPILQFSYVGMEKREIRVTDRTGDFLHVKLTGNTSVIDEVVVTGYQAMNRRELASAIATVKAEDVIAPEAMSIDQMLQGKIPGMTVMTQSGEPSSTPTIRIRGNSTINGNKAPVWVVDGVIMSDVVPFTASDLNSPDAAYLIGNSISGLSPQDIESISVLKDASATAIYGVKAANGVIVVTTKRGTVSAPVVTYDAAVNVNTRPRYSQFDLMNSQERVQLSQDIYEARLEYPRVPIQESYEGALQQLINKKISQSEFTSLVGKYETMNSDWFKALFRPVVTQNHNVSVTGGTEKVRYYTSLSYNNSPGIAKKSESERFTGLSKLYFKINRIFDVDLKMEISNQNNEGYSSINPFSYAFNTSRAIPIYGDNGELYFYAKGGVAPDYITYNVLNELDQTGRKNNTRRLGGVMNFNARLFKGLTYTGTVSYYWNDNRTTSWATDHSYEVGSIRQYDYGKYQKGDTEYERSSLPFGGKLQEDFMQGRSYTIRNTLNYVNTFAEQHSVNLFGGIEIRSEKYSGNNVLSYGWDPNYGQSVSPVFTSSYISLATNGLFSPVITERVTQIASYIGSASYCYDERYILNANIRSDGANKFGSNPKYRWLPTWSLAGKWIVSNERFMEAARFIDHLSLRASYGLQGNIHDDATPYLIVSMNKENPVSGLRPGTIERLPNPDLRWEKTHSYNIGLDLSFFKNRLNLTLDYYRKKTTDLITDMQVSLTTGRSYMFMNAGEAINKGIEGVISADLIRNKTFSWNVSYNFSHNTNEVRYAFDANLTGKEVYQQMLAGNVATIGQPLGTIYSFKFAGLSGENGYPLFYTTDGRKVHDGDYEAMELVPSGSIYPDLSGGFDTRLTYKNNLSLSIGFSYQLGAVKRLPSIYNKAEKAFDPSANLPKVLANRWKQPGDEQFTNIPALYDKKIADGFPDELRGFYDNNRNSDVMMPEMYDMSDLRIAKNDFLRLRNVTLSYRLPGSVLNKLNVKEMTIRLQGSNLKTWAPKAWDGLDPTTAYANMPLMPSYSVGVSITF